jgi:hypothetical protein
MSNLKIVERGQTRYVPLNDSPAVRQMSQQESNILQQYAAGPVIMVEQALQAQEGADERTSGIDRSRALLLRLAPLAGLWLILGAVCAVVLCFLVEVDATFSAVAGLVLFVFLSYNSYAGADERERYDSRNGVEHHRIDVAESLTLRKLDHEQELKRLALEATLKQLEARGDDY